MTMITEASFLAALEKAVADRGFDYVYPINEPGWALHNDGSGLADGCRYFLDDGSPACIIGYALAEHGYGPDDVREGQDAGGALFRCHASHRIQDAANRAQLIQDGGGTWGKALETYKREIAK